MLLIFSSFSLLVQCILKNHILHVSHCAVCNLDFKKLTEYNIHINGKRHNDQLKRTPSLDQLSTEFSEGASNWTAGCSPDDVLKLWSNEEWSTLGFKFRATCLHPSPTVKSLKPKLKARVWRYLRDGMGLSYFPEIANIMYAVEQEPDGHLRIKEIFESFESYRTISNFIISAKKTDNENELKNVVELACGHGLVSVLLAYRFPNLNFYLFDLLKRPTFEAFIRAFEKKGLKREGKTKVLPNIFFHEKDLKSSIEFIPNSIVVCVHGCGDVNKDAVELAIKNDALGWIVMSCCINKEMYLGAQCLVSLSDDMTRHHMLCGAFSFKYDAQLVTTIDSRLTNRNVLIGGGVSNKKMLIRKVNNTNIIELDRCIDIDAKYDLDSDNNEDLEKVLKIKLKMS